MSVTVVDDRAEWASPERFPGCEVLNEGFEDYLDVARFAPSDHILVTTHDHGLDRRIVAAVIEGPQSWTGMIGSQRKAQKTREFLATGGLPPPAIDRLRSPVGLPIRARTPEEIAISILAELVELRHRNQDKRPRPRVLEVVAEEG